jgi:micrococcal nuclease
MKKGAMIGIGAGIIIIAVIVAGNNMTQNQTTESIGVDTAVEKATGSPEIAANPSQLLQQAESDTSQHSSEDCSGTAGCFRGTVTKIIDGDTIHVDDQSVRFALASAPNLEGYGGVDSRNFVQTICPVGSKVLVDEDDGHVLDDHARMVGMITCNDMILNEELLDASLGHLELRFCSSSEFANESWAVKHGCITN